MVDEVYACSVHRRDRHHDNSLCNDDDDDASDNRTMMVQTLYGFAKDFGFAGWRVGVLHSRNQALIAAVRADCHHCEASTLTLGVIEHVLSDASAVR